MKTQIFGIALLAGKDNFPPSTGADCDTPWPLMRSGIPLGHIPGVFLHLQECPSAPQALSAVF